MPTPQLREHIFNFTGYTLPTPFKLDTVQTAGTPAGTMTSGGFIRLSLDATNEVQSVRLSNGDVLPFDIDNIHNIEIWAKVSASLNAACSLVIGACNAGNAAIASITKRVFFTLTGGELLKLSAVDGTHTKTAIATGMAMATADWQRFMIDFKSNTVTMGPPASLVGGVGGKASVGFKIDDPRGNLRTVAQSTQFDMSAETGNLQLYAQLQKTAAAAAAALDIKLIKVVERL